MFVCIFFNVLLCFHSVLRFHALVKKKKNSRLCTFFFCLGVSVFILVHVCCTNQSLQAHDLLAKDISTNSSDPLAILRVGDKEQRTKTIDTNLYPEWEESFDFACTSTG